MTAAEPEPAVVVTVTAGPLAFTDLSRVVTRFEGAKTHRLLVKAGERTLTMPESWKVEPSEELLEELRSWGNVTVEVTDGV